MNNKNEIYKKAENLFGKDLASSLFPEFAIGEALIDISAMIQMICNILVAKGVITQEEYLKCFSDEGLEKVVDKIKEQANLIKKGEDKE